MLNASSWRLSSVALALACVLGAGCSTIIRPTKPDAPLTAEGAAVVGIRFDGEETVLRESGAPMSPSRSWRREVENYAASSLNTLLQTPEGAATAHTVVNFEMATPSVIQIGTWKEMTISLTSTLPDGTAVKSAPLTGNIDDVLEYAAMTTANIGGTVLNAAGTVALVLFFLSPPDAVTGQQNTPLLFVAIGSIVGGVLLSVGQSVGQYFVASNEEKRWSNLFAAALRAHAADVRKALAAPKRAPAPTPGPAPPPPPQSIDPSDTPLPPILGG